MTEAILQAKLERFETFIGENWSTERLRGMIVKRVTDELGGLFEGNNRGAVSMADLNMMIKKAAREVYSRLFERRNCSPRIAAPRSSCSGLPSPRRSREGGRPRGYRGIGRERADAIRAITGAGIPVMGHIGLTPPSIHQLGGFRAQGKTALAAKRLVEDALLLEEAGCFSIVLESVPARLAELISKKLSIPTIGIGAGNGCEGQVLVTHDLLGLFDRFTPKFVKKYADFHSEMQRAFADYIEDVETKRFPAPEHTVEMADKEWEELMKEI